jgi:ferrous iron transport protein A
MKHATPASDRGADASTAAEGSNSPVALSAVATGESAVIVSVDSASAQGRRLLDLGFLPDTAVRVVRRAPLGDPIQFELRGCNFCLRKSEADDIRVIVE